MLQLQLILSWNHKQTLWQSTKSVFIVIDFVVFSFLFNFILFFFSFLSFDAITCPRKSHLLCVIYEVGNFLKEENQHSLLLSSSFSYKSATLCRIKLPHCICFFLFFFLLSSVICFRYRVTVKWAGDGMRDKRPCKLPLV